MLISTTNSLEGKNIKEYRGIVFGEVVNGTNFLTDISAGITNVIGGRSEEFETELIKTRADALNEMIVRAQRIGANGVIGVKVDYETVGGSMLMVVATGTAVVVEGE